MRAALVAIYIAAMVIANLLVWWLGKWSSPFIAFVLIGLDLTLRDRATAFVEGAAQEDDLVVGRRLVVRGRLAPSTTSDETAVIDVVRRGGSDRAAWWWEASEHVRDGDEMGQCASSTNNSKPKGSDQTRLSQQYADMYK